MTRVNIDAVAAIIAEVAAREIQPRFRSLAAHEMREKGPGDIVTIADEQAELALTPRLLDQVPGSRHQPPQSLRARDRPVRIRGSLHGVNVDVVRAGMIR